MAYQSYDVLTIMEKETNLKIKQLAMDNKTRENLLKGWNKALRQAMTK